MSRVRVCFLGTPDFAVTALKALLDDEHFDVVGVVTQPDRPSGRKLQLSPSPVKNLASQKGLKVLSPESLKKNPVILDEIRTWRADVAVVVAFGQILTQEFMDIFHFGCVNIHGSLLPRWRGAAPIQRAIEAGDVVTGVTLQKIVKKLDAGDVLGFRKLELDNEIDAAKVYEELAVLGAELLRVELMDYIRGNLGALPQDESLVTFAKKIEKSESMIDWNHPAEVIHNKVRAFTMGPGTQTILREKKIKVHKTRVVDADKKAKAGEIITGENLVVQTSAGALELLVVQPESRNRISGAEFVKGYLSS